MRRTWMISLALTTLAIVSIPAGCRTTTPTVAIDAGACSLFPPITWSSRDTPETIIQIRRHNAGRDAYCEK